MLASPFTIAGMDTSFAIFYYAQAALMTVYALDNIR